MAHIVHVYSVYSMEDSFDKSQELNRLLLASKLNYLRKPDAFPSLSANGKVTNKAGSSIVVVKVTGTIKVKVKI